MAVPPVPQARTAVAVRAVRVPLLLDVVVGLLVAVALPVAVVAIPNTISMVAVLLPPEIPHVEMMRVHGLALPAMVVTVPLAVPVVRRFRAAPILLIGLVLLAVADAAGGYANSIAMVGVLRVLHGIGAGMLVPATLAAAARRPRRNVLLAIWAGALAVSLLSAQALALWPLDDAASWRITLQPYPLLTGVALALAAVHLVLWLVGGTDDVPAGDSAAAARFPATQRSRIALTMVPAAGIAALGIGMTFNWPSILIVVAAAAAVLALLGLAAFSAVKDPGGHMWAFVNVAVGIVVLPTAAQVTNIELRGVGGPGLNGLWLPLLLVAAAVLAVAVIAGNLPRPSAAGLPNLGLVAMVAGLCLIRLIVPAASGWPLVLPLALLTAGAAVALVGAFRPAGAEPALLHLSLCFPALLAGFLLGTGIQVLRLSAIDQSGQVTGAALVSGFIDALHWWSLAAGGIVVGIIVLAALSSRRAQGGAGAAAEAAVVIPAPTPSPEDGSDASGPVGSDR